jgi:hypothetical protein
MKRGYFNKKSCDKYNIIPNKSYRQLSSTEMWEVVNVTKFYIHLKRPGYSRNCVTKEFNNKFENTNEK